MDFTCFLKLRESTEFASWAKATDRAETCEFLEDKLHEVEADLKELREESWIFHFQCNWICSLLLLVVLIVALLALVGVVSGVVFAEQVSWWTPMATRRKVWRPPSVVVGWCDESDSFGEEIGHGWLSLWLSGRISE